MPLDKDLNERFTEYPIGIQYDNEYDTLYTNKELKILEEKKPSIQEKQKLHLVKGLFKGELLS